MLDSCILFENNGNYSQPEINWYTEQMKEIDDLLDKTKDERTKILSEIKSTLDKMLKEPFEKFSQTYKQGMQNLSAKEGFGKKYGLSRRVA